MSERDPLDRRADVHEDDASSERAGPGAGDVDQADADALGGIAGAPQADPATAPDEPAPSPFAGLSTGPRAVVGAAFDLLLHAGSELRRGSFYAGFIALGTLAPLVLLVVALAIVGIEGLENLEDLEDLENLEDLEAFLELLNLRFWSAVTTAMGIAMLGLVALSTDSIAMTATLLGARLERRPMVARSALGRARMVFWRLLLALIGVGVLVAIAQSILGAVLEPALGDPVVLEMVSFIAGILFIAPFAYVATGIVLGDVRASTSLRRSVGLVRLRPGTGLVVALFAALAGFLPLVALFVGLDLVARVFELLAGLIPEAVAGQDARLLLILLAAAAFVFAAGTLLFTVQAIAIAPQVVAFLGLTHATYGLEKVRSAELDAAGAGSGLVPARDPDRPRGAVRWLPWPMAVGIVVAWMSLAIGLAALLGA